MTDIDLDELERLAKAATPGPWETYPLPGWEGIAHAVAGRKGQYLFDIHKVRNGKANAAYIVAACNAVPELIERVRELEREKAFLVSCLVNNELCFMPQDFGCSERTENGFYCYAEKYMKEDCALCRAEEAAKEAWE